MTSRFSPPKTFGADDGDFSVDLFVGELVEASFLCDAPAFAEAGLGGSALGGVNGTGLDGLRM